jgi:ribosome-associated protein
MDFGDVVVHVFYDDVRGYYDLESLWMDARRIPVPGQLAQD